ncbi:hypothetical protein QCB44_04385 [Thiomicrorhabdus sp. zzn3]|uniref:hypothetical protein n=1 Tax=Thiomicrorhabdus sp. zzn3 TaxID=3039775 RepID=UPI0024371C09|nr:hypothetical protein [Thiomicrorhabdus sp. zzn3]MDG6777941.1 hypothetical protein [Thiomicrorhabdus sp. zzn3]
MLKKWLLSALLMSFSLLAHAQTLQAHTFEDQWKKPQVLNAQTQWVIFSSHKAGGEWVKNALSTLETTDLAQKNWLYVADISAMPSLISKFVAIPKMQDYKFAIALEKEGEATKDWPKQDDKVSVYKLNALEVVDTTFLDSEEAVIDFLKSIQ